MTHTLRRFTLSFLVLTLFISLGSIFPWRAVRAAEGEFYLQVSPSPLVATLKPGQKTTLDLKIRNAGNNAEKLTIVPRTFNIKSDGQIELHDTKPPEVAGWLRFSSKDFIVAPGQLYEQKITVDVPKEAGFSYAFALMISRQSVNNNIINKGQELKGQVAVFALITIDRPGATRALQIESMTSEAAIYEYLPSKLTLRLKNTGNTIVQPAGDVFMQRGSSDETPIDTLAVNKGAGYILPGTVRELPVQWENGFPAGKKSSDGVEHLDWNWQNLANIRIGHYTAKAVVVYNDGSRDIPLVAEVGFWVIPWKLLLGALIVGGLIIFGLYSLVRTMVRPSRRAKPMRLGKRGPRV